jgi:hypothetical protein
MPGPKRELAVQDGATRHDLTRSLGPKLRRFYQPVLQQPTPSSFLRLLRQLQHAKRSRGSGAGQLGEPGQPLPPHGSPDVLVAISFGDNRVGYMRVPSATAALGEGSMAEFARKQQLAGLLGEGEILRIQVTTDL